MEIRMRARFAGNGKGKWNIEEKALPLKRA
jgi:hypothetical protein